MRHLSWIVTIPVTVVAVVFAVANRETVPLSFWPLPWSLDLPVYLIVLGCLLAGFLLGGFVAWVAAAPRRRRARQTTERARELAREVAELRRREAELKAARAEPTAPAPGAGAGVLQPASGRTGSGQAALEHLPGA